VEHPKDIGDRSTIAIMLALRDAGYAVLLPFGENTRYDLVIDDGERLARVQSTNRGYQGEVDFFAVYCRATTAVYLIPIGELPNRRAATLRVDPSKNNQAKGLRPARKYELGRVAIEGLRGPSGG
jgi:hypothetical protein